MTSIPRHRIGQALAVAVKAAELDKICVAVQPVVDQNAQAIGAAFVQSFYGELKKFRTAKR